MQESLGTALQESVLCVLCFKDQQAVFLSNVLTPELFESGVYAHIARVAIGYVQRYKRAPGSHLDELLEDKLNHKERNTREQYKDLLVYMYGEKDTINGEYVVSRISEFLRGQKLKTGILSAVESVKKGQLDEAENQLTTAMSNRLELFDPGTSLIDTSRSLSFFHKMEEAFPTGIPELDRYGIGPQRGAMMLIIAKAKSGKSWSLVHLGKHAMMHRLKVLHITCEMPEWQVSQRYIQSLFAMSKRQAKLIATRLEKDEAGKLLGMSSENIIDRPHFEQEDIIPLIKKKLGKFQHRLPMVIKEFPSGKLTLNALKAYMDNLEQKERFVPDLLLLDYPDIMYVDPRNKREALGQLFVDLRGLAQERNVALATVTQSNRTGASKRTTEDTDVAEDWSKIATADTVLTYNRTKAEYQLGLARLFVSNVRSEHDKFSVLLSQSYDIGQFCLDSALMTDGYWSLLETEAGAAAIEEED